MFAATAALAGVAACVRDSGPGIPAEVLPHIFERYYSAGLSHSKYDGAGLGLSIAKKIVEAHQGRIWVDSVAGHGATFSFTLPLGA